MKKLILLLLFIPLVSIGQKDNYYEIINNPLSNGIDLKFKIPEGFKVIKPKSKESLVVLNNFSPENQILITFLTKSIPTNDELYNYTNEEYRNLIKLNKYPFFGERKYSYFSIDSYPGMISDSLFLENQFYLIQSYVIINKKVILIQFGAKKKNTAASFLSEFKIFLKSIVVLNKSKSTI